MDNAPPFKVPRVLPSSYDIQDSMNQGLLNQVDSQGCSTSKRNNKSTNVVVKQNCKIYNVVHMDEVDNVVVDFLWEKEFHLVPPIHHIIKKW